jgi:hypothetical protein
MPICERDAWRFQFFDNVDCPADINIPTDDRDCFEWFTALRWVYDKSRIAASQGLACGMANQQPPSFPVFAKPNVNLLGMGLESKIIHTQMEFENLPRGHMWMPLLTGEHRSTDLAVVKGKVCWLRHALGFPWHEGMFTHWMIETKHHAVLDQFLSKWVEQNLSQYTGMLNIETIAGVIIEAHLRFADQWCDLYGEHWNKALVRLYAKGEWIFETAQQRLGFSVPLFARHGRVPPHPPAALQTQIRNLQNIASLQITYHTTKPDEAHPMPPGGFRLGIINCWDLEAGIAARQKLAAGFSGIEIMLPSADKNAST